MRVRITKVDEHAIAHVLGNEPAEINEAKNTFDLMQMTTAIAWLDALHAEMEAASKFDEDH
jgi:hypothetical protein